MAKKKEINALQRFLNVCFIAWVLFMGVALHIWVLDQIAKILEVNLKDLIK